MPTICKKPRDRQRSRDNDDGERAKGRRTTRRERRAPEAALPITDDSLPDAPAPDRA